METDMSQTENMENQLVNKNHISRCRRQPLSNVTNFAHPKCHKAKSDTSFTAKRRCDAPSKEPFFLDPYNKDILDYFLKAELKINICPSYMSSQPDLKPSMRGILVDWLIQACMKFKLNLETQFLAIQLVDRYLSKHHLSRNTLQLVGITSIFIAAKFEEIMVPTMNDLVYITENTYTTKELVKMESQMLETLDYDLGYPSSIQVLRYLVKLLGGSRNQYYQAKFICELLLLNYGSLPFLPSQIGLASLDILDNTLVERVHAYGFNFCGDSVNQCKNFIKNMILSDEVTEITSTVITKYNNAHQKLKLALQS